MTRNLAQELCDEIIASGALVRFGLRAQGHLPTIERMLAEGADWPAIGAAIGWDWRTAKEWYERDEVPHA